MNDAIFPREGLAPKAQHSRGPDESNRLVALPTVLPEGNTARLRAPISPLAAPLPAMLELARLLGQQAARQSSRNRARGCGIIQDRWATVFLALAVAALALGTELFLMRRL